MVVPPTCMTDTKPRLRRIFRDARRAYVGGLSPVQRAAFNNDLARVAAPAVADCLRPGSYAAVGNEIDPVAIDAGFADVSFPRVSGDELHFHCSRREALVPGILGIPAPTLAMPQAIPDLLLVPLLAVTLAGVRLGQGKGHYDRTLAALRRIGPVRTIALAWDCQIANALPEDPWDIAVDFIATPTRLVDCRAFR